MNEVPMITLLVHTRDSVADLPDLLGSTRWCDERIVIDMESMDGTVELARADGCEVVTIPRRPFADVLRNEHLARSAGAWTLVLDADERLSFDAESSLRSLVDGAPDDVCAFALPRRNRIAGHVLTGPLWSPDHQIRLFRTASIRYLDGHHRRPVAVDPAMRIVEVDPAGSVHIDHRNYDSIAEFIERQLRYAISDHHDADPRSFDFDEYLIDGQAQFDARLATERDGAMSYALATVMYWDRVVRGLLHWEASGRVAPLPSEFPAPGFRHPLVGDGLGVEARTRIADQDEEIRSLREQLDAVHRSRSMRLTEPLRRIAAIWRTRRL